MISEKVWSRIYAVLAFLFLNLTTIDVVVVIFGPYILGSQVDMEYIKSIDTAVITSEYTKFEDYEIEDGRIKAYSDEHSEKRKVRVTAYIYEDNEFGSKAKCKRYWYNYNTLFGLKFNTVIEIKKNNVKIIVTEFTSTPRSKKAQEYLEEVLAQLE